MWENIVIFGERDGPHCAECTDLNVMCLAKKSDCNICRDID